MVMWNREPRWLMNHNPHHSLTQDNIIIPHKPSTCPFLIPLPQTQGLYRPMPTSNSTLKTILSSFLFLYLLTRPDPSNINHSFSNHGVLFINTRLFLFHIFLLIFSQCCSPPKHLIIISENTCHLFT